MKKNKVAIEKEMTQIAEKISKSGYKHFKKTLKKELGDRNIPFNAVMSILIGSLANIDYNVFRWAKLNYAELDLVKVIYAHFSNVMILLDEEQKELLKAKLH